jgi:hypothetical protein
VDDQADRVLGAELGPTIAAVVRGLGKFFRQQFRLLRAKPRRRLDPVATVGSRWVAASARLPLCGCRCHVGRAIGASRAGMAGTLRAQRSPFVARSGQGPKGT